MPIKMKDLKNLGDPIPRDPNTPIVIPPPSSDCTVPLNLNQMRMSESHGDPRIGEESYPELEARAFSLSDDGSVVSNKPRFHRDQLRPIDWQYLEWLRKVCDQGEYRGDRTGTGTISLFGEVQMRVDLRVEFPALVTKYVHFIAVDDELDWMKSGSTNIRSMKKNGTRIWDEWVIPGTEEYRVLTMDERVAKLSKEKQDDLESVEAMMREDGRSYAQIQEVKCVHLERAGIPEKVLVAGELGPVYGSQWRYWEDTRIIEATEWQADPDGWQARGFTVVGKMFNGHQIVINRKVDQIAKIEKAIRDEVLFQQGKLEKHSAGRRIILSGWNVAMIEEMALPPCHTLAQWYVSSQTDEDGKHFLDCEMFQRSGDMFLGVPFNMAQYALFTCQLAHANGLRARYFTHAIGDAHIYSNHQDQVQEQLKRDPYKYAYPHLHISREVNSILELQTGDCKLMGYEHYPAIKAKVAV